MHIQSPRNLSPRNEESKNQETDNPNEELDKEDEKSTPIKKNLVEEENDDERYLWK